MFNLREIISYNNQLILFILFSFLIGTTSTYLWISSNNNWSIYLKKAYDFGVNIHNDISYGYKSINNEEFQELNFLHDQLSTEEILKNVNFPSQNLITSFSMLNENKLLNKTIKTSIHIVSPKLKYPIAELKNFNQNNPQMQLGKVTELLAKYCSNSLLFIKIDKSKWYKVNGDDIWTCNEAPYDYRLTSIIIFLVSFLILSLYVRENKIKHLDFIKNLKNNLGTKKDAIEETKGPKEYQDISKTLISFIANERKKLENRLMVLSSISHDIGTPATKLKLRTTLIDDKVLKEKLDKDIDKIIKMMDGVLAYTRSELDLEEIAEISLISLIESIVFDYQDLNKNVSFKKEIDKNLDIVTSIFGGSSKKISLKDYNKQPLLIKVKPLSLQRAINNLIDNALKYGRSATLSIQTSSDFVFIIVEDEGKNITEELINNLKEPFLRGKNSNYIKGTGLGLTIVSTIAEQHSGSLNFEKTKNGLKAILKIKR